MDRTTEHPALARMEIPRPGGTWFLLVFSLLLLFFGALACYYLVYSKAMPNYVVICATLYLLLVIAGVWCAALLQGGFRQYLMNKGATLASCHFVEISQGDGQKIACFGFSIRNRRYDQLCIPTCRIVAVSWGAGQGSESNGRQRKDWMVALWYHSPGARRWTGEGWSEEAALMVGRGGSAAETAVFGQELVQFLRDAGVELVAGERELEFRVNVDDPGLPEK
tara:strand:- start:744 stop:1412 length:669 start_codon:yes stop_codon:yes gene_type:complete